MPARDDRATPRCERGMALVIVLILLLVMTLLGVASMRGTLLEERMSGNLFNRSLAFQAAEAALREGEAMALRKPKFPAQGCTASGLCAAQIAEIGRLERWLDPAFSQWANASVVPGSDAGTAHYLIEDMGLAPNWPGCNREIPASSACQSHRYRISARSGGAGRAEVLVQSQVIVP